MTQPGERVLVVGAGNLLLGDEGLGVHVARMLRADPPPLIDVLEAGTNLFDALPVMARYQRVIIVDAMRMGAEPGAIHCLEVDAESAAGEAEQDALSLHEWGVLATLRAGRQMGLLRGRVWLLGAEPESLETSLELSPRLAEAARRICRVLRRYRGGAFSLADSQGSHSK